MFQERILVLYDGVPMAAPYYGDLDMSELRSMDWRPSLRLGAMRPYCMAPTLWAVYSH